MRALAWLGRKGDPPYLLTWGGDFDTMQITGQLGVVDGGGRAQSIAARWDPPAEGQARSLDFGWIGEDAGGVWLAQHPETALLDHPDIADVYERCRLHPELTPTDRDTLSAWQYTLAADFCAAFNRRQLAEVKDR